MPNLNRKRAIVHNPARRLPTPVPRELADAMRERGVQLLLADPNRSERQMRLRLAAEFGYDEQDLVCVMVGAGVAFHNRYVAPFIRVERSA